jgi:hypothetical protein|tara:strand:+ start:1222 stop:1920 length:699 start_codon:yes stop_codon:yes gene_type:complete
MAYDPNFNNGNTCEDRYNQAVHNYIQRNAAKGAFKRWLAEGADHQELYNWLEGKGEYATLGKPTSHIQTYEDSVHPLRKKMYDGEFGMFLLKLADTLSGSLSRGKLSPNQTEVVRKALARAKDRHAKRDERKAEWDIESAKREYVGEIGDKKFQVKGKVTFVLEFDGQWGTTYLTIIRDVDDNTIKYMGKFIADKGCEVSMIATIKAHEEYKNEKQTVVNRPRNIEVQICSE